MLKRIITAVVALAVLFPILYFGNTPVLPITFSVLTAVAVYELYKCTDLRQCHWMFILSLASAVALPILVRYADRFAIPVFMVLMCVFLMEFVLKNGKYKVEALGLTAFESLVIIAGFTSLVFLYDYEKVSNIYILVFIAAWGTDTMAYFAGRFFGKKKLCPEISPKKTVAGAIGGVIGCVVGFIIFAIVSGYGIEKLWIFALVAIPLSIIGQFGDLAASVIKRNYGIKDYGNLFPGHGGVMDRFDSILPIAILAYVIIKTFGDVIF